jgi:hypothetical protein
MKFTKLAVIAVGAAGVLLMGLGVPVASAQVKLTSGLLTEQATGPLRFPAGSSNSTAPAVAVAVHPGVVPHGPRGRGGRTGRGGRREHVPASTAPPRAWCLTSGRLPGGRGAGVPGSGR